LDFTSTSPEFKRTLPILPPSPQDALLYPTMSLLRSTTLARTAIRSTKTLTQSRLASGGAHFNEPTGYLFGEKVHTLSHNQHPSLYPATLLELGLERGRRQFIDLIKSLSSVKGQGMTRVEGQ